jgi:putative ABC transport system permease protein
MPETLRHLQFAARSLLRLPAFSLAVVASLGISIAAITTVFSVADAVLFRALPYRDAATLVWITSVRPQRTDAPFSLPEYMDYADRARTVDIAAFTAWSASMATPTVARRLQGMRISANGFDVLGVSAAAGRLLRGPDDRPDAPRVVLLSHAFWVNQFAGDPAAVGQVLRLNDQPYQVIGVLPRYFPIPLRDVDVVAPLSPDLDPRRHVRTSVNFLRVFGRLRGAGSIASARQELSGIAGALRARFPAEYATKLGVAVTPMQEFLVGGSRQTIVVMLGAATLLLGIALANVLNLLLVRGGARKGEMALRRALGGAGRHLAYGAASEAVLLAVAGAALGAILARWLVSLVAGSTIAVLRLDEARVAGRTLWFVIAISMLATLLFSAMQLVSALRSTPLQALSAIGRGLHGSRGEARLRGAFLVAQLGFAVLLTIVTATMARSLARLQAVELGYRPDSVFVARLSLPPQKYRSVAQLARFTQQFEQTLRGGPGVAGAGVISIAPLSGSLSIIPFNVVGREPAQDRERLEANLRAISPGYLSAVGARVAAGRDFAPADDEVAAKAAIVSRALADRYFPSADPLGRQLLIDDNNAGPRPVTVVGVVENMRHVGLDGPAPYDIYIPMAQVHPDGLGFVTGSQYWTVKVAAGTRDYPRTFTRTLGAVDRDVAVARVEPMRAYVDDHLSSRKFSVLALLGFALVALVLATIGVYGVVAYSVQQRRREIGLRLALGASPIEVARSFIVPAFRLAVAGVVIGVVGAVMARRAVAGLLFGVAPTEPMILGIVAVSLLATSAVAAAIPARRAARIDPAIAFQDE